MISKKYRHLSIIALSAFITVLPAVAFAAGDKDVEDLYTTLAEYYSKWLLPSGTVLAGLVIMYGGISYAMSGGDPTKTQKAKEFIFGAISGLILLIVAPLIIKTITQ